VQQAIYEHLKVHDIDQPYSTNPEEGLPSQSDSGKYGERDDWNLQPPPYSVSSLIKIGAPAADLRTCPLVYPPDVRPPETSVAWARYIFHRIGFSMVMTVIRHPPHRFARRVEDSKEYQYILDHSIQSQ
jgi:hypothetical protein